MNGLALGVLPVCDRLPDIGLVDLMTRAEVVDNCLEWTGYANAGRFPQWRVGGRLWPVRRLVWELSRGPIKPDHQVNVKCGNELCVHPDHLVSRTRSKLMTGVKKASATRARIAHAKRKAGKIDAAIVAAIRQSDSPCRALDAEYGLKRGYAWRIKNHLVWRDYSSPFARLGAPQ